MTIGRKLHLGFGAAFLLTLLVGGIAYWNLNTLSNALAQLVTVHAKNQFVSGQNAMYLSDLISAERGIVAALAENDKAARDQATQDFLAATTAWKNGLDQLRQSVLTDESRSIISQLQSATTQIEDNHAALASRATAADLPGAASVLRDRVIPLYNKINPQADRVVARQGQLMAVAKEAADREVRIGRWLTLAAIALSLLAGAIIVLVIRHVNLDLRQTAAELTEGAHQVASAATQVASSSQSLAQGSSEQAASLEQTSASTEEINSMARQSGENSRAAAGLVTRSEQRFVDANALLDQMVHSIGDITTHSGKISKIIKVIDEIAFQTNILALNAAVEAARAGEAGMGFAVVADEVRNLAQRCAQAAKDTAELIEESIAKSHDGKVRVDRVAEAIQEITHESAKVKALVEEVQLGSRQQTDGIEQVAKAITQMEQVTQSSAANAEESAAAAEQLSAQSQTLKDIVERLIRMVGGGQQDSAPAPSHHRQPA